MGGNFIQGCALLGADARDGGIREHSPIQELHDVERGADHAAVLAQAVCLGHGDVSLLQRMDDLVFSFDLVRGLRQELAWGFLAQHELVFVGAGDKVGWVGLSEAEL